jgi:hypothetical protein
MAMRGLDSRRWRKARQDYARIVNFIDIVNNKKCMQSIISSSAWKDAVEVFQFLSLHLPHCSEDGFRSAPSGKTFFTDNFSCMDAKNLVWYVLNEIDFLRESQPYETRPYHPTLPSDQVKGHSTLMHYTKTKVFWVLSLSDENGFQESADMQSAAYN